MANDRTFLQLFLDGAIDSRTFRHADHLRGAFELIQDHDFSTAAYKFSTALKVTASRGGNPEAYHETITLAFLSLVAERNDGRSFGCFEAFACANPDLMQKTALERWYRPERLRSNIARRVFVLPEVGP